MYDLLPVSWAQSGVAVLRCTICCGVLGSKWGPSAKMYEFCGRCFGLEVGSLFLNVRFVAGVLGSMWRRSAKIYDLLPVSWARSGVPVPRCICCRCFGLEVGSLFLNARFVAGVLGSMWSRSAKMYDLLRCLGLEVGSLCEDVRFCCRCLVSKRGPNA